jgi:hypothetical protein
MFDETQLTIEVVEILIDLSVLAFRQISGDKINPKA